MEHDPISAYQKYRQKQADEDKDWRLEKAAPELLLALKNLLACPDLNLENMEHETYMAMEDARLAINKADGTICPD